MKRLYACVALLLLAGLSVRGEAQSLRLYDDFSTKFIDPDASEGYSPTATTITASFKVADFDQSRASLLLQQAVSVTAGTLFLESLGTSGDDYASSVQQTTDGGFIIAGYTNGSGAGGQDVFLVKLNRFGVIQWAKTAGSTGDDVAFFVRQTSD